MMYLVLMLRTVFKLEKNQRNPKHPNCVAGTTRMTPVPQSPLIAKLISPEECYKHKTFKVQLLKTLFYLNKNGHPIKIQQPPSSAPADFLASRKPPLASTQCQRQHVILALRSPTSKTLTRLIVLMTL